MNTLELILLIISGIIAAALSFFIFGFSSNYLSERHNVFLGFKISLFYFSFVGLIIFYFLLSGFQNLFGIPLLDVFETTPEDFPPIVNGTVCQHFSSLTSDQLESYVCIYGSASQTYEGYYDELILSDDYQIAEFRSDIYEYNLDLKAGDCFFAYGYLENLNPNPEIVDNQTNIDTVSGDYNSSFTACTKPTTKTPPSSSVLKQPTTIPVRPTSTPKPAPTSTPAFQPSLHGVPCKHFTQITDADIYQNICVYGRADRAYSPTFSSITLQLGYRSIDLISNVWVYDEYVPAGTCVVAYGRPQNNDFYINFIIHSETEQSNITDAPGVTTQCDQ